MRAMSGHDSRSGCFNHARSIFYGDDSHVYLPSLLFPWGDELIDNFWIADNHTAFRFLDLLKKILCSILQDAAVMIHQYNCTHYIYK